MERRRYVRADESDLLAWARDGDERAFAWLLAGHRDLLHSICFRITGHPQDAEDALQVALLSAWKYLHAFQGRSRFSTWLYRIAHNAALAVARQRRPEPVDPSDVEITGPRTVDPRSFVSEIADRDAVTRALTLVQPDFRAALVLREYGGLSYEEIAQVQGIRIETVKTRIARARQALARLLA